MAHAGKLQYEHPGQLGEAQGFLFSSALFNVGCGAKPRQSPL